MIQKARIVCYGIDDELKNDASSIFSTETKSTTYPVPAPIAPNLAPAINNIRTGVEAVNFTRRLNTKRFKYSLNPNMKNLSLSKNAKLVIESITIPNIINDDFLQSKCINNVILKLKGINNHNIWDSSTQGKGSSIIFTSPILLNTQGFGYEISQSASAQPDLNAASRKARINCDNNGYLFLNTSPNTLYNFPISEDFFKNGILEFELIYELGNITRLTNLIGGSVNSVLLGNSGTGYGDDTQVVFNGGNGIGAAATVNVGLNVANVFFTNGGTTNYTTNPSVTFSPATNGGITATGTVNRGFGVLGTNIVAYGSGYTSAPTVTIAPPPPILNATATAVITGGVITGVNLTNPGLGYVVNPIVTITGGGGTGAAITANRSLTTTQITGFTITNGGTGYTTVPTITITGGGGVQATATTSISSGMVIPVTMTNAGSGYTVAPTITLTGGGGSGASQTAVLVNTGGTVKSITLTNVGAYVNGEVPTITITGGGGAGAVGVVNMATTGSIQRINLTNGGTGYTANPTISFNSLIGGAGATGATATTTTTTTEAHYTTIPQSIDINTDKNDLEGFMISLLVIDEEEDDKIYNSKSLLNKINKLLLDKADK